MSNYILEAENLFREFAERHSLSIQKDDSEYLELSMKVPVQTGLSFDLILCLQNVDELNIGVDQFWSYFFPFPDVKDKVAKLLDGLISGSTRLAINRQLSRTVSRDLETLEDGNWRLAYREASGLRLPLLPTKVTYVYNARSAKN